MTSYTHKKSSVFGGSWSTPFGTPFFIRWGEWSLKVPMAQLREEYDAWEKLQRRTEPEPSKPADPIPSLPSGPFDWADDVEQELFTSSNQDGPLDWAEDVEQELFSDTSNDTDVKLDSNSLDTDTVVSVSPIVEPLVPEGVAVVGAGTTLCTIPEEDEEEDVEGEDEAADDLDSIDLADSVDSDPTSLDDWIDSDSDPTPLDDSDLASLDESDLAPLDDPTSPTVSTPSTNNTVYRIINISTTGNDFSLHMVEDGTTSGTSSTNTTANATDPSSTANELFEAIQFLATAGLLNLDTYATVFDTAARVCAAGPPFWLHDPLGDREIAL